MGSVVSLLVTDIVGSTRRWVLHESAMVADLRVHDELIAGVVAEHRGSVFKHTGDGAMAAFDDPADAMLAASKIQSAVTTASWQTPDGLEVRAAVHAGTVHERDGDLFGSAVNRAARLLDECPPGAVLVSGSAAALVTDHPFDELTLRPVGEVHLRGFVQPESVHAVDADHLTRVERLTDAPAIDQRTEGTAPRVLDELVGRGQELAALRRALQSSPLVSLVGVGGMGKTRLAVEAAAGLETECPDGVWWCDLASATSDEAVGPVLLEALCARHLPGRTTLESVTAQLSDRRALVVLDNCEHVIDTARAIIEAIQTRCPTVRLLATTREALGLPGEVPLAVTSLPADDAVALFLRRAQTARPDLEPTGDILVTIRSICERVDAIPLAIELAAARCRSMSPAEVADRLSDRFRLLRGGRASSERHRTLQAAVAWSHSLLDDDERTLFDSMAVFADGTLLDGLARVADLDELDALDLVDRLVSRSLVAPIDTPLGTRYRQLETLRQFAEDRLIERGTIDELRDRHLAWMLELAERISSSTGTPEGGPVFDRFVMEIDNLRVACSHAEATGRPHLAERVVAGCYLAVTCRPAFEVLDWCDPVDREGDWDDARAEAATAVSALRYFLGDTAGHERALRSVPDEFRRSNSRVVHWQALAFALVGDASAADAVLDAFEPDDAIEDRRLRAARMMVWNLLLFGDVSADDIATFQREAADVIAAIRAGGDDIELGLALTFHAFLLANGGRPRDAVDVALEAAHIGRTHGAGAIVDSAGNALAISWGRTAAGDAAERSRMASEIRRHLVDASERRNHLMALAMLAGTGLLLVDVEPDIAHLLELVRTRIQIGYDVLPTVENTFGPDVATEMRATAQRLSVEGAVALAIAALDRLLDQGQPCDDQGQPREHQDVDIHRE